MRDFSKIQFTDEPDIKLVLPNLQLNAEVEVIRGKYTGDKGKVIFARSERITSGQDNIRLTIDCGNNRVIIVDMDDIKGKYETMDITLFMPEDERAAFKQRVKELEEYGYDSI